jgi:hypothetical protein
MGLTLVPNLSAVSILEDGAGLSYFNFFLEAWKKRLLGICFCYGLLLVA